MVARLALPTKTVNGRLWTTGTVYIPKVAVGAPDKGAVPGARIQKKSGDRSHATLTWSVTGGHGHPLNPLTQANTNFSFFLLV